MNWPNASTGTGTTSTADAAATASPARSPGRDDRASDRFSGNNPPYRGRFAPSPTGPLHLGSLVAATASYLQALHHDGDWLLRIEDIDPPREVAGATERIIETLDRHGFRWSGDILYQSSRLNEYRRVVEQLLADGHAYCCRCSRQQIAHGSRRGPAGLIYPGTCRNAELDPEGQYAVRLRTKDVEVGFIDMAQGPYRIRLESELGDFVIRRRDGLFAYNLAVVIDDHAQGITEVVRGTDLLALTPAQLWLQQILGLPHPGYLHVPLVTNAQGQKLSKQTGAKAVDDHRAGRNLVDALRFLGLEPPASLAHSSAASIWDWAVAHRNMSQLRAEPDEKPLSVNKKSVQ